MSGAKTCRGCGAIIVWVRARSGKAVPCNPGKLSEWITDEPTGTARPRVTLLDPDGDLHSGYMASVLTAGARQIDGFTTHFATCPKAAGFRK